MAPSKTPADPWHYARPELAAKYLQIFDVGLTSARALFAKRRMGPQSAGKASLNQNRYAPPAAPVTDVLPTQTAMQRPRQVVVAVQLAAINYVFGLAGLILSWDYFGSLQPIGALIFNQVFSLAIFAWLYSKIYAGRNWARITLLVLFIIGMLFTLSRAIVTLLEAAPLIAKAQMLIGLLTNVAILWLLFLSPGRDWFRKHRGNVAP
jgi:hypothetical protein